MRYDLPPGLTPEEVRAIESAIGEYLGLGRSRPDPWTLAGRAEALGLGALQLRHQRRNAWSGKELAPFTRLGTEPRRGRAGVRTSAGFRKAPLARTAAGMAGAAGDTAHRAIPDTR